MVRVDPALLAVACLVAVRRQAVHRRFNRAVQALAVRRQAVHRHFNRAVRALAVRAEVRVRRRLACHQVVLARLAEGRNQVRLVVRQAMPVVRRRLVAHLTDLVHRRLVVLVVLAAPVVQVRRHLAVLMVRMVQARRHLAGLVVQVARMARMA
jgi:hypothetical protein